MDIFTEGKIPTILAQKSGNALMTVFTDLVNKIGWHNSAQPALIHISREKIGII
jgi:hypothetical protein